ncbi:hypothetical protein LI328DRAFT_128828 [Trichoderma asperelloides]|nr:hypothetical protein LI328DRAFT_128828 [Trichoderma asperelloides]
MLAHAAQGSRGSNSATHKCYFSRAEPAVCKRNTTIALHSFLHGVHIHPCYDAGNAGDGPTRVLHLGSPLTLPLLHVLWLLPDRGKYLCYKDKVESTNLRCQQCPLPNLWSVDGATLPTWP